MTRVALTTIDNPFNPFTHFVEWLKYDQDHDYNTSNFIARLSEDTGNLSDADQRLIDEMIIDEILLFDTQGLYKKVTAPDVGSVPNLPGS